MWIVLLKDWLIMVYVCFQLSLKNIKNWNSDTHLAINQSRPSTTHGPILPGMMIPPCHQGSQKSNVRSWFLAASNSRNLWIHLGIEQFWTLNLCFVGFLSLIIRADSERWLPHLVTSSHFKPFETRESIGTIPKRMEYRKPTKTKPPATKTSLPCRNCSQAWRHSGREVSRFWETSAKSCLAANHQRI